MIDPKIRLHRQRELCRVVNKYNSDFDINICRGTIWGNPFPTDEYPDAIDRFKIYFKDQIRTGVITKNHLEVLRGQRLGCVCKPKDCHGDFIASVVNRIFGDDQTILDHLTNLQ